MAMSHQMNEMDSEAKASRNKDRIILNVGGVRHETFKSTLRNFPDTRLAWITGRDDFPDYDPEKNEYFFDRHPGVFQQIMNFYRTGKLHCPSDVCGPLFEEELTFWGIDEKQMESCCWSTYTLHREAQENLKVFNGPEFCEDDAGSVEDVDAEWEHREPSEQHRSSNTPAWQRWRSKIWSVFNDHTSSRLAKIYVWVSLSFVVVSVMSLCAYTDDHVQNSSVGATIINVLDYICGIWFTAEFILRSLTCPDILNFSKQFLNWIDLLAVIPFYLNLVFDRGNVVSEILLLVRMLRLFRFFKMSLGLQILKHTLVASSREMFLLFLLLMIPVLIFAGILHLCENHVEKTKFTSIPEAFWWAIITLTTVGYGDMTPSTTQGKIFGSLCAGVSMLISALPISIIGANFSLYYRHAQAKLKLPKKPRKALIGADNTLMRVQPEEKDNDDEHENSERNSSDDLTTEVYLGPRRPRRERMSLFANGVAPQRSIRIRSLGGDHLPGQINTNNEQNNNLNNEGDDHKSSLLSTSTKSTLIDSPPPRSVSFPTNLQTVDKCGVFDHGAKSGIENPVFSYDTEDSSQTCNGKVTHPHSAGSRRSVKRNGINLSLSAPRVTITTDCENDSSLTNKKQTLNLNQESEQKADASFNETRETSFSAINSTNSQIPPVDG